MTIDAHQHIWDPVRASYPWLDSSMGSINRTIAFEEILPTLEVHGIEGTVLVQAADNDDDTNLMLEAAANFEAVVAVVAWVPLDQPVRTAVRLDELLQNPIVRGVRALFHTRPREWTRTIDFHASLELVGAAGLSLDFVTASPDALADLLKMAERHPNLAIAIDHLGKPPVGGSASERSRWRTLMAALAAHPQLYAKISGLYSSVGELGGWTEDAIRPFFDDALELFGASRLMYGSDWPISDLAGGYDRVWHAVKELVSALSPIERENVLSGTAERFYRIETEERDVRPPR